MAKNLPSNPSMHHRPLAPTFAHLGIAVVKDRHCGQDGTLLPIVLEGSYLRFIPKLF